MKQEWKTKTIQELCEDVNVGHVGPSSMHRDPQGIPFLMGKNVGPGEIFEHNIERVTESFHRAQRKSQLRPGDIVVVRIGKSGQAAKIPEGLGEANCSGLVVIKQPHGIDPDFLVYYLNSPAGRRFSLSQAKGSTRPTLNTSTISATEVPVPPLAEQQRIVRLLDEAFERIAIAKANAKENFQNARKLFESQLSSIYSDGSKAWPSAPLGIICEVLDSLRKPVTKRDRALGPYPYYGATGVVDHVANFLFDEPLVLVGEDGAKWGPGEKSAFLVSGKVWVNNHAHVIRPDRKRVLDQWLVFYLTQTDLNEYVSGLTVPKLNQGSLREIPIPLPKIAEQQRIVDALEALEARTNHLARTYAAKLRACELLSSSLLNQVFSGNLLAA